MTKRTRVLTPEQQIARLTRIRWAARGVLALGVAASVVANVLHADPNPISQGIAAWPPLALLITVEFILPIPVHRRSLANIRLVGTALIAGIAAWVSYWHMVGVVLRYGESADVAYLLPLSVDGLVVVASVSLVELTGHIRSLTTALDAPAPADNGPAAAPPKISATDTSATPSSPSPRVAAPQATAEVSPTPSPPVIPSQPSDVPVPPSTLGKAEPEPDGDKTTTVPPAQSPTANEAEDERQVNSDEQPPTDTPGAVAYWHRRDPSLTPAEIATKIGKSSRTVRRWLPNPTDAPPATAAANRGT